MTRRAAWVALAIPLAIACGGKKKPKDDQTREGATAGTQGASATNTGAGAGGGGTNTGTGGSGAPVASEQKGCLTKLGAEVPQGDLVFRKSCGPVTIEGEITIDAKLTIEPGVTVRFAPNASLWIGYSNVGTLIAEGTQEEPIVFASAGEAVPGVWRGIHLSGQSRRSRLAHLVIEHAGGNRDETMSLKIEGQVDSLKQVTIKNGKGVGLLALGEDDTFAAPIEGCRFEALEGAAMRIHPRHLPMVGKNTYGAKSVVEVTQGELGLSATLLGGATYRLLGDVTVHRPAENAATPTLAIEPGCVVEGTTGAKLYVGYASAGSLKAIGAPDRPVRFTGFDKRKGGWGGIVLSAHARDVAIEHAIVEFAEAGDEEGAIRVDSGAAATVRNVSFEHLDGVGLSVAAGAKVTADALKAVDAKGAEHRAPTE